MMFYSIRIMDPNSSLGKICLGDDVIVISSEKVEGSGDWNSPKYQDTAVSKGKKVMNALSFYRMETDEISERYIVPCFVNGLEAFDGEVNLAFDENLILNEFAITLCLDYEILDLPVNWGHLIEEAGKPNRDNWHSGLAKDYALLEEVMTLNGDHALMTKYKKTYSMDFWKG
ncbi:hypothetical protein Tco_0706771 [Tanacetum coccineum]|uniref:Uncharacterized protein n=1 Tax=Tanacetum coccineum TaxID=301880 RepID=A0ABQ4YAE1_9ASTR